MNKIKVEERELINLHEQDDGTIAVSGRELHDFLEIGTRYNDWFKRMIEYGFIEDVDYGATTQNRVTAQGNTTTYVDHVMTIDMAKEISMIQRNDKGKLARRYFIEVEKAWHSPEMIMKRALQIEDRKIDDLQTQIATDKPKVLFADAVDASHTTILVREHDKLIQQNVINIVQKTKIKLNTQK